MTDHFRERVQLSRSAGSVGQERLRARHCKIPDSSNMVPATPKTKTLCSESQISCGTADMRPTIAAPNPNVTRSAGSAQQMSVLRDVKSDSVVTKRFIGIPPFRL